MTRSSRPRRAGAATTTPSRLPRTGLSQGSFLAVLASAALVSPSRVPAEEPGAAGVLAEPPSLLEGRGAPLPAVEAGQSQAGLRSDPGSVEEEEVRGERPRLLPHYEYLEDSYLDYFFPNVGPVGDSPLAFEAQVASHFFILNQWKVVEETSPPGSLASVLSWDLSFVLKLRMVRANSEPIRPPSYMPSTHLQWFGLVKTEGGGVRELEAEGALAHHSNGQGPGQCSFVPVDEQGTLNPTTCLSPGQINGSLRHYVNYRSGDFTTSYVYAGLHYAYMTLERPARYLRSRVSIGIRYEQNFVTNAAYQGFPGAMHPDQAWIYGIHRANLQAQGRRHLFSGDPWLAGVAAATLSQEFMWNTALGVPKNRTILELSYVFDRVYGMGFFARGYTGQDYMNILYAVGRTTMFQFGIIWSMSPEVRYRFGEGPLPDQP
ncbi:MAG TPA: hypothetical protein VFG53_17705 [Anaeromyxobacter sp.]|nr:hypothetical protein [Anaeromyxobacter sp.]